MEHALTISQWNIWGEREIRLEKEEKKKKQQKLTTNQFRKVI